MATYIKLHRNKKAFLCNVDKYQTVHRNGLSCMFITEGGVDFETMHVDESLEEIEELLTK